MAKYLFLSSDKLQNHLRDSRTFPSEYEQPPEATTRDNKFLIFSGGSRALRLVMKCILQGNAHTRGGEGEREGENEEGREGQVGRREREKGEEGGGRLQCGLSCFFPSSSPSQTLGGPSPAGVLRVGWYILPELTLHVLHRLLQRCPPVTCDSPFSGMKLPNMPRQEDVFPLLLIIFLALLSRPHGAGRSTKQFDT